MILAGKRLAALVAMIRDYDPNEAVSIVAHSQGCLITLLAQAFLMEQGKRPADTLILTHPPYSLEETLVEAMGLCHGGGEDEAMRPHYNSLNGQQTLKARMETLLNIVKGVAENQKNGWSTDELKHLEKNGVHTAKWEATQDRDNRGKVYLYFCPEDMTVALPNVQGIGWQGVPYKIEGSKVPEQGERNPSRSSPIMQAAREPLKELGARFLQRVFTAKVRPSGDGQRSAFKVGLPPQDFVLREEGEHDHDHVTKNAASHRADLPETDRDGKHFGLIPMSDDAKQKGLRYISGEALTKPSEAEMYAGSVLNTKPKGAFEPVDAVDAAIAVTSQYGLQTLPSYEIDDPCPDNPWRSMSRYEPMRLDQIKEVEAALNEDKPEGDRIKIDSGVYGNPGKLSIVRKETANEARLRHQHGTSDRSFHGAIIGGRRNHANVTAYDVTVGQGLAVSHPDFYRYLCAVADWRLKKPRGGEKIRPSVLEWSKFQETFALYWSEENADRKMLIEGNCDYYSTGVLPHLPDITQRPKAVVCETTLGRRTDTSGAPASQASHQALTEDERKELGEWADVRVAGRTSLLTACRATRRRAHEPSGQATQAMALPAVVHAGIDHPDSAVGLCPVVDAT
ncbi:MAG: DUF3274 domain-containing protein [Aquabacterium sp.]